MEQLSGIDAGFLHMETASTFGHVCSVSVLEPPASGPPVDLEAVRALLEQRMHLLPPFRRKLAEVPLGLDRPYWVDDADFDLDFHVREIALPAPGSDAQLAEQVSRIASRPLDRTRPLWELYLISGLAADRSALMVKFHHAAVDGIAGRELMMALLDNEPDPVPVPPPAAYRPRPAPGEAEMLLRGLGGLAVTPARLLAAQGRFAGRLAKRLPTLPHQGRLLGGPALVAPRTSFNRMITPHRRWAFGSLSLDAVKAVKTAHGVTVNDVVMALCAGALRRWLRDHGELPDTPLLAMVPLSVRTEGDGAAGNQVSAMIAALPTHVADPVGRLRASHEAMKVAKDRHRAIDADVLADMTQFAMPALAVQAARVAHRFRLADVLHPAFNLVVSNVPGPREPLYLCGARLAHYYPVSVLSDGLGLNITVQSYLGNIDVGIVACRELVPDVADLVGHLADELEELTATPG